ncbi:MAG: T9SS type A sorting domain-containing protein [Elusimicrobia bacterium]|nr:T9SS type A sorting domain-containing protein [Elusimicrobiota bacterium]
MQKLKIACLMAGLVVAGISVVFAASDLSGLNVFPNPVRPHAGQNEVVFDKLTDQVHIEIYDADGNIVLEKELGASNAQFRWNLVTNAEFRAASGVYIYLVSNNAGEKKLGKLAVIR